MKKVDRLGRFTVLNDLEMFPFEVARAYERAHKIGWLGLNMDAEECILGRRSWRLLRWFYPLLFAVSICIYLVVTWKEPMEDPLLLASITMVFGACCGGFLVAYKGARREPLTINQFMDSLEDLSKALKLNYGQIAGLKIEELRARADEKLCELANSLMTEQKIRPLSVYADDLRKHFAKRHAIFSGFELAEAKWGRYFEAAAKRAEPVEST